MSQHPLVQSSDELDSVHICFQITLFVTKSYGFMVINLISYGRIYGRFKLFRKYRQVDDKKAIYIYINDRSI